MSLLFVLLISEHGAARRNIRRGGYRSPSRTTPRPRVQSNPQQTHQVSETRKGEDYRKWATKLTGAGSDQPPKLSGSTGQQHQGSNPSKIGWNVPETSHKQSSSNVAAKPSAPLPDQNLATKASAPSLQSGYNPSAGHSYGQQQPAANPYGHSAGQSYNPPINPGYNPPIGGQSYNQPYNPSFNQPYNPPIGQSYNPSHGHSYNPSMGQSYNPPVGQPQQTVLLVPGQSAQPYKPGIGQLAKEALVFAGVSAGVNAAVNRLLPGGHYGNSGGAGGGGSGSGSGSTTHITYNNYYNNQSDSQGSKESASNVQGNASPNPTDANASSMSASAGNPNVPLTNTQANANTNSGTNANANVPPSSGATLGQSASSDTQGSSVSNSNVASKAAPASAQDNPVVNPSPTGYIVTDSDIQKLSEELFAKDKNNAYAHITMSLQGQKTDDSSTDDAPEPLLAVKPEALEIPTIKAVRSLFDNYELNTNVKEDVTLEERKEELNLLDTFLATDVLSTTMKYLADKGYIPNDEYEFKDTLKRIWFSQFKRAEGEASSSGFETVFLAEQLGTDIIGLHDWIYFNEQETAKKANYLGYIKQVNLKNNGAIVKIRSSLNDIVQPVTTIFVGTSPELEMALYTLCFFTRPNSICPISLGETKFVIFAIRVNYFGKDILISAYPDI